MTRHGAGRNPSLGIVPCYRWAHQEPGSGTAPTGPGGQHHSGTQCRRFCMPRANWRRRQRVMPQRRQCVALSRAFVQTVPCLPPWCALQDADAMYEPRIDQQASGRIGPEQVALHKQSAVGDVSIDATRIESLSNFSSARATTAVFKASNSSWHIMPTACQMLCDVGMGGAARGGPPKAGHRHQIWYLQQGLSLEPISPALPAAGHVDVRGHTGDVRHPADRVGHAAVPLQQRGGRRRRGRLIRLGRQARAALERQQRSVRHVSGLDSHIDCAFHSCSADAHTAAHEALGALDVPATGASAQRELHRQSPTVA